MPRKYTVSDAVREAHRNNARKPRGKWAGTKEREAIERAKSILRECLEDGAILVRDIIADKSAPAEIRLQAFKLAADRAGMPMMTQQDVSITGSGTEVWNVKLGWPEATQDAEPGAGDHDGRDSEQPAAH